MLKNSGKSFYFLIKLNPMCGIVDTESLKNLYFFSISFEMHIKISLQNTYVTWHLVRDFFFHPNK